MKRIEKDELYDHLSGFLSTKGIELKEGSYTTRVQQGCSILADLINLSQDGFEKAKSKADESIDRMRQVIHEKTAPRPPKSPFAERAPEEPKSTATQPPAGEPKATGASETAAETAATPKVAKPKAKKKTAAKKTVKKRAV